VFGVVFLVFGALVVASLVMTIVAIVDMARRPDWQWKLAGQDKALWIVLSVVVNVLGVVPLIYWFHIRKKLIAVEQAARAGVYGPGSMTVGGWVPGYGFQGGPPAWPPGWYADPADPASDRWWDGARWTESSHVRQPPGPPAG
jgi:hypothetical protein